MEFRRVLCRSSEDELANGDAAAALRVGPGEGLARFIGSHSVSADFVDHFRTTAAEFDYGWEARWIREEGYAKLAGEAVSGLLAAQGLSGLDIAHFAAAIPAKGAAGALAAKAGIAAEAMVDAQAANLAFAGAGHPLFMLTRTAEEPAVREGSGTRRSRG